MKKFENPEDVLDIKMNVKTQNNKRKNRFVVSYMPKIKMFFFTGYALDFFPNNDIYIWVDAEGDLILSNNIDPDIEEQGINYFKKKICTSASYNGGGVLRATVILSHLLPEVLCASNPKVVQKEVNGEKGFIRIGFKYE